MSELWVLLELMPLVALALLVGAAGISHRKEDDEPKWWSDFEREFGLYVARTRQRTARERSARER